MPLLTGGCTCGAARYRITAEPGFSFHCQCRQCQCASGTGPASLFVVPRNSVLGKTSGSPDVLLIAAASLDAPALFKLQKVVFGASGQPWDYVDPALPIA